MDFLIVEPTDAYPYTPTPEDWAEYEAYLDSLEEVEEYPEKGGEEIVVDFDEIPW